MVVLVNASLRPQTNARRFVRYRDCPVGVLSVPQIDSTGLLPPSCAAIVFFRVFVHVSDFTESKMQTQYQCNYETIGG